MARDGIDLSQLRKLNRDLKGWNPDKETKRALKMAGQLIVDDARARIQPFSQSIPPTIKARTYKTTVKVYAGGAANPKTLARELSRASYGTRHSTARLKRMEKQAAGLAVAGLLEMGNKGVKPGGFTMHGKFRHPVFAKRGTGRKEWTWVNQEMHPYLYPSLMRNLRNIEALEGHAVAEAFTKRGFKVY